MQAEIRAAARLIHQADALLITAGAGCRPPQTAGRSGRPKMAQRLSSSSWMQRTPAGLPWGMPGMGEEMEGAVQQAPQPGRHSRTSLTDGRSRSSR